VSTKISRYCRSLLFPSPVGEAAGFAAATDLYVLLSCSIGSLLNVKEPLRPFKVAFHQARGHFMIVPIRPNRIEASLSKSL